MAVESEPAHWVVARDITMKRISLRAGVASFMMNGAAFWVIESLYKRGIDAGRLSTESLAEMRPGIFIGPVAAFLVFLWVRSASRKAIGPYQLDDEVSDRTKEPGFWWRSFWVPVLVGLIPYAVWIVIAAT